MSSSHGAGSAEPPSSQLSLERLAHLAVGTTTNVELCRVTGGEHQGKLVAVKRLLPHVASDPDFVSMFRDEMWMASALKHPNVAQVLGWGEDSYSPYLAVEFVRGVSLLRLLRSVIATGEDFQERLVVHLAAQVCDGLTAAHELRAASGELLQLVHRDLTPGNILLGFDGDVKISDFGLAKAKQRVTQTAIGVTKGELAYMSPEQVMGRPLDARSDLFALGVVMFELFAHQRPWQVDSVKDALVGIVQAPHPDLGQICPRIDAALVTIVHGCLHKDPARRYQNARALEDDLDRWLQLHGYRDTKDSLARFVRRNSLRHMRWIDRAIAGEISSEQDVVSPFDASREVSAGTPVSQASGVMPSEGDESTRSVATRSRSGGDDLLVTTRRRASHASEMETEVREPRTVAQGAASGPRASRPDEELPPTVGFARGVLDEPATIPGVGSGLTAQGAFEPTQVGSIDESATYVESSPPLSPPGWSPPKPPMISAGTRVSAAPTLPSSRARAAPPRIEPPVVDEPSSPVPLVIHAESSVIPHGSMSDELRMAAHHIRATANQLAAKAGAAAEEARAHATRAGEAARRAAQTAHAADLAAEAMTAAAAAVRAAADGDEHGAAQALERARALHEKARG